MASCDHDATPSQVAGDSNGSVVSSPAGMGGVLDRERVVEIQRARILVAITVLVGERGVAGVTVAHVVGRSGVSRRTFYELFDDRDDCLHAAFEHAVERAAAVVLPAYEVARGHAAGDRAVSGGGVWVEGIRAGLGALLRFLDEEPAMGGLCAVDALGADRVLLERRAEVVEVLIDAVHRGGAHPRDGASPGGGYARGGVSPGGGRGGRPARIVAEGAVGAVLAVIHARLRERAPRPLVGLLGQLMGMIVLPYLGSEAAARELERRAPRARRRPAAPTDPLRDLDMRLTYRTMRVLLAIAELGGGGSHPSSREVADASGVSDQGQMSKLLWRLEHLGLIANGVVSRRRGEPNAWSLTSKGREVQRAIRAQTGG